MSQSLVVRCREVSGALMAFVDSTRDVKVWLDVRCDAWEVDGDHFRSRLSTLALIVCYALAVDAPRGDVVGLRLERFLDVLRDSSSAELFAPIRSSAEYRGLEDVREIWVVSVRATGMTPLYWSRLRNCLEELTSKVLAKTGPDCTAADLVARAAQAQDDTA
ncbi:hypothetical protein [Streptomyces sp. NPDC059009]|uniref:hypothetical protein n=1 Tax=Streptomyces sp. NPDC059009 TaxID=3346694 RepID=UPI0036BAC0CC